jgi:hypothetical protein
MHSQLSTQRTSKFLTVVECSFLLHHINKSLFGVGHKEDILVCVLWQELGLPKTFKVCCICLKYNISRI